MLTVEKVKRELDKVAQDGTYTVRGNKIKLVMNYSMDNGYKDEDAVDELTDWLEDHMCEIDKDEYSIYWYDGIELKYFTKIID